ncbi:CsbD family protein [Janibacter sp. DB-40]|uniref:CsbD family protein n=1 Tax=Janibacter sp. DB-40 TaxID=3028808 RepID=UPI002406F331|nr:CsbD family protein [Janibacter sp. DB-40]
MGMDDKFENAKDENVGKAKAAAGKATGDEEMRAEGKNQEAKGNLKSAGEKAKDAFKK